MRMKSRGNEEILEEEHPKIRLIGPSEEEIRTGKFEVAVMMWAGIGVTHMFYTKRLVFGTSTNRYSG
ncbi:Dual oxidase, partial [Caligus rogercresseyi]